jgi:PAS domain S-box-containing protein
MIERTRATDVIPKNGITSDYKIVQHIIGFVATAGVVFTSIDVLVSPAGYTKYSIVWPVLVAMTVFICIFFLIPSIYMKKQLAFLPDIVFTSGFLTLMINLSCSKSEVIIILLILLVMLNAFAKSNWLFILSAFETLMAIIVFYLATTDVNQTMSFVTILFQLIGIVAIIAISRIFAQETIYLRGEQKKITVVAHQLESQRNEILTLINNFSDGLISVDRDQKITIANTAATLMLCDDSKDKTLVGKILNDVMPVTSDEASISLSDEVLKSGISKSYEDVKLVVPKGMFRISVNTTPIKDSNDRQSGAIVSFRDITAEKSLEEQRVEFNAVASHELRTPLMVMDGFMYNLLFDKRLKYDEKTKEYISQVDKAVKSLIKLTNDILTVTKSDNNQIEVVFEKTDIKKIIKDAVEELKPRAKAKKLKLSLNIAKDLPVVLTDESKFKEIALNLIENAIKYTDAGSIVANASENEKGVVRVEITDTGEGISEDDQKRIFNRFFRVNDFRTQKVGGTGLGLYIARTFVTALGGEIGVKSKKNEGSTFWFTIPVTVKKKQKKNKTDEQLESFISNI